MATTHVIDADHLKCVLFTRRLARFANYQGPKWAAMSNGHDSLGMGCPRRPHDERMQRVLQHPPLFRPGNRLSPRLVERVRLNHGLNEVKATWGTGYKALLAELQPKKGGQ
jgi:hypothetical protein